MAASNWRVTDGSRMRMVTDLQTNFKVNLSLRDAYALSCTV